MNRPRVYLACPVTLGDREHNFRQASDMHLELMTNGFAVLNPALTMRLPWAWDRPHAEWLECCLPWVAVADVVLRLPGESKGADMECDFATVNGKRVFTTAGDLYSYFRRYLEKHAKEAA